MLCCGESGIVAESAPAAKYRFLRIYRTQRHKGYLKAETNAISALMLRFQVAFGILAKT